MFSVVAKVILHRITIATVHLSNLFFPQKSLYTHKHLIPNPSCSQLLAATILFPVPKSLTTPGASFTGRSEDNLQELVLSFHYALSVPAMELRSPGLVASLPTGPFSAFGGTTFSFPTSAFPCSL